MVGKRLPVTIVTNGNDQVSAGDELTLEDRAGSSLRDAVRHRKYLSTIVLISRALVDQRDICSIVVTALESRDNQECLVRVGVDKVVAAVLIVDSGRRAYRARVHLPFHNMSKGILVSWNDRRESDRGRPSKHEQRWDIHRQYVDGKESREE